MPKRIPVPPPGLLPMDWHFCVEAGDSLYFDVSDPGWFDRAKEGLFNPDLPRGQVPAGPIGPMVAQQTSGELVIGYFDQTTNRLFLITLTIQPNCPP